MVICLSILLIWAIMGVLSIYGYSKVNTLTNNGTINKNGGTINGTVGGTANPWPVNGRPHATGPARGRAALRPTVV
jgi:hypothetical protein